MSAILLSRIIGAVILGIIGAFTGLPIHRFLTSFWSTYPLTNGGTIAVTVVVFLLLGFLITPYITIKPVQALRRFFSKSSPQTIISAVIGFVVGLLIAALLAYPLSMLPGPVGQIMPVLAVVLFGYLGALLMTMKNEEIFNFSAASVRGAVTKVNPQRPAAAYWWTPAPLSMAASRILPKPVF